MLTAENGSIQLSMLTFFIHSEFFIVDCLSKVPYKVVVVSRFVIPKLSYQEDDRQAHRMLPYTPDSSWKLQVRSPYP